MATSVMRLCGKQQAMCRLLVLKLASAGNLTIISLGNKPENSQRRQRLSVAVEHQHVVTRLDCYNSLQPFVSMHPSFVLGILLS